MLPLPSLALRALFCRRAPGLASLLLVGVIVSVLEPLRANLEQFTLAAVLEEVSRWMHEGLSRFGRQWQALQATGAVPAPNTS